MRERTYAVPRGGEIGGPTNGAEGEGENGDGSGTGNGTESDDGGTAGDGATTGGEGVTTRKLDRYELTLSMTYGRPRYVGYDVIDIEWQFADQEFDDFPRSPADAVAIGFRPVFYAPTNARDEWVYYSRKCGDPPNVDSKTLGGAACAWRDYRDLDDAAYFGVYVEPNWRDYDAWERRVYVDFVHTWSGYGLTGVSTGFGELSMSFGTDTDRWDVEDSAVEARLIGAERIGR
ncbi:hypothetical protein BRD01_15630 [Halobacteriales archaeon QS_8_65_32]|nr:MAG: hypothetical protein BRD01_15630 [Halobacteriales archaeon QS_8_65_32]